jgi:hypothetical protein
MSSNNAVLGENSIFDNDRNDLFTNVGRLVTIFTQSGGESGEGFTGLLIEANCRFIKLITSLPSAPRHPFGIEADRFDRDRDRFDRGDRFFRGDCCRRRECSRFGTVIIIPVNKIVAFVFNEI